MNIFVLDKDPVVAAKHMHDRHILKMTLESAQMLSTTQRHFGNTEAALLKKHWVKHPCNIWVRASYSNYIWLAAHFKALCDEFAYRYYKIHSFYDLLPLFGNEMLGIEDIGLTPFVTVMPKEYITEDPIESYRAYYLGKKIEGNKWTNRTPEDLQEWLTSNLTPLHYKLNKEDIITLKLT